MHFPRLASSVVFAFAAAACSDSDSPDTSTSPNQPTGSTGGSAGSSSTSAGGSGGMTAPAAGGAGGSSAETPATPALNQGGGTASSPGGAAAGAAGMAAMPPPVAAGDAGTVGSDTTMSFFVTSRGVPTGGNFGGLDGADALCDTLATAVSAELGSKTWHAYLSTATVNARDRIGTGPWFNQAGVLVANNVAQLVDQGAGGTLDQTWAPGNATIALDETGAQVPAGGNGGVQHDIITGTLLNGTVATGFTCGDWTAVTGTVQVGHSNRGGGGMAPSSWSSAHNNVGCAPLGAPAPNVSSGGGRGSIYCFAIN